MSIANAAHCSMMGGGKKWVNPYITDGLICMYDGIWNAGPELHDESTLAWKNLGSLGSAYDAIRNQSGSWAADGAIFTRQTTNAEAFTIFGYLMRDHMKGEWSYEIGFTPKSGWKSNYAGLWGNHANGKGIVGGQYNNGRKVEFVLYPPVVNLYTTPPSTFSYDTKYVISQSASDTSHSAKTYKNGSLVKSVSNVNVLLDYTSEWTMIGSSLNSPVIGQTDRMWKGTIHFLRVYNRPITADEVAANHAVDVARYGMI